MKILLIAATAKEIKPFLNEHRKSDIFPGVDVLISGIGLTATAYHLTKQIQFKKPDLVIQAGVAGCFDKKIPLGSVVMVTQDTIADQSVIELKKLKTLFALKLVPQNQFPFQKGWLVNPHAPFIKNGRLRAVKAISVNQITTSKQMIRFYQTEFHPAVESMEGAALHYVCLMEKIPFLQIRSISNYIGERDKKKWNMNESIFNLNKTLTGLLNLSRAKKQV
ncbi:MAG: futalosine hydrolase [Bacteroidetes bacterium]|nr:futalosine hydrolase [Bacteroidota bacterium]MBS1931458.1 futalosine hydrolase [Bacteroidota bacterium]